jgi:hypothetical protein
MNNEDKKFWCDAGLAAEKDFIANNQIKGWGVSFNPLKQDDPYTHDYIGICPMDVKTIHTKWIKSQSLFGIPSDKAISINKKDFQRYAKCYPNILILCHVTWQKSVYLLSIDRARKLIDQGKAKLHVYKNRTNDTKGNAKSSYIFDTDDLDRIHE